MPKPSIPIVPSGAFFPRTAEGYIVNPCDQRLIDEPYRPVIQALVEAYIREEGARLHSVYLRGSVPRGMVITPGDIDTFALIMTESDRWRIPGWAAPCQQSLQTRFPQLVQTEMFVASYGPVKRSLPDAPVPDGTKTNPALAMIIQTQSLCLYGEDLTPQIPPYQPGEQMMLYYRWLEDDIHAYTNGGQSVAALQQLLKTIVRSGFELVMPKIKQYTPDLYLCYRSFSDYHPKKEPLMRNALQAYLNPESTPSIIIQQVIEELAWWLVRRFARMTVPG